MVIEGVVDGRWWVFVYTVSEEKEMRTVMHISMACSSEGKHSKRFLSKEEEELV